MDFSELTYWFWWSVLLVWSVRKYLHYRAIDIENEAEGRSFGPGIWQITTVLLFPWALRKAEKDFINE